MRASGSVRERSERAREGERKGERKGGKERKGGHTFIFVLFSTPPPSPPLACLSPSAPPRPLSSKLNSVPLSATHCCTKPDFTTVSTKSPSTYQPQLRSEAVTTPRRSYLMLTQSVTNRMQGTECSGSYPLALEASV